MEAGTADLRDMRGPSALSHGGWRRFLRVLARMAKSDFQLRYERPALGYIWSLLSPLLLAGVLYLAFTRFVRFGGSIPNYPLLLIFNITLFYFFSQSTSRSVQSFVQKQSITRKVEFPLLAVPMSAVAAVFLTFLMELLVAFGLLLVAGIGVRWTWLLFPLIVLGFVAVTSAGAVLLSSLYVRVRDIGEIWTPLQRALFYASPVLFPIEFFPPQWHFILYINPLAPLLAQARVWVIDPSAPTYAEAMGGTVYLLIPLGVFLLTVVGAIFAFRRYAPRAAEI
jgi:ABC-2 type transport system permease protein